MWQPCGVDSLVSSRRETSQWEDTTRGAARGTERKLNPASANPGARVVVVICDLKLKEQSTNLATLDADKWKQMAQGVVKNSLDFVLRIMDRYFLIFVLYRRQSIRSVWGHKKSKRG